MLDTISATDERLSKLCQKYQVASLKVFGSVARGDVHERSDIDLLVQFVHPVSLLTLVRLERELSTLFGRKVDLVTEQAISPYIREAVLSNARALYEEA